MNSPQKIALIMNQNCYSGREYLSHLKDIDIDVISIGKYPEFDKDEEERCGNYWKPETEEVLSQHFEFFNFESLKSNELEEFLLSKNYDLGIQGGTGILRPNIINLFKKGLLNFHPGDLPKYRGCSAPEWQLFDKKEIVCSAHIIDIGIDSGAILAKKVLNIRLESYEYFRASIYPEVSKFVREIILDLLKSDILILNAISQDEDIAIYRDYIGYDRIQKLKEILKLGS